MAPERRNAVERLRLRRNRRMANDIRGELSLGFRLEDWRINSTGADRKTRTLLRDRREALLAAAALLHHAHHAVMLAVPSAARWEIYVSVGGKERRDQRPAEQHHQRKCNYAPHCQAIM